MEGIKPLRGAAVGQNAWGGDSPPKIPVLIGHTRVGNRFSPQQEGGGIQRGTSSRQVTPHTINMPTLFRLATDTAITTTNKHCLNRTIKAYF